jgi:hypothetical protein
MILENPFMKLVKKIGSEAREDVAMREPFPEGLVWTETLVIKFVHANSMSGIGNCIQDFVVAAKNTSDRFSELPGKTTWASALVIASNETLFWVVCDIGCQNRIDFPNETI